MWIRESLFNLEKGYEDVWGAEILGAWVPGGLWKIDEVKGEGIKSGNKTKDLIT